MTKAEAQAVSLCKVQGATGIPVRVTPNCKKSCVSGLWGHSVKVRVAAPAEKGKANKELCRFMAAFLKTKRSNVSLHKGKSSRNKLLLVKGVEPENIRSLFAET